MPELNLTDDEVALLTGVIDQVIADLRYEVADTDNSRFRDELRERRARIEAIAPNLAGLTGG
jgi:hypothetical protein